MSLISVNGIPEAAGALDSVGGVGGFLGRVVGLGADEQEAGVPGWSWFAIGLLVGGVGTYVFHDQIDRVVG